jgi:hypothetical protein
MITIGCPDISFEEKPLDNSLLDKLGFEPYADIEVVKEFADCEEEESIETQIVIDSSVQPAVLIQCMLQRLRGKYRREFGTGVIYERIHPYYYKRKFQDVNWFINEIFTFIYLQ